MSYQLPIGFLGPEFLLMIVVALVVSVLSTLLPAKTLSRAALRGCVVFAFTMPILALTWRFFIR